MEKKEKVELELFFKNISNIIGKFKVSLSDTDFNAQVILELNRVLEAYYNNATKKEEIEEKKEE